MDAPNIRIIHLCSFQAQLCTSVNSEANDSRIELYMETIDLNFPFRNEYITDLGKCLQIRINSCTF